MPELDSIVLRVLGDSMNVLKFRMKRSQSLRKLMFEYSARVYDKSWIFVLFYYNDHLIMAGESPISLQMNDNDVIYATSTANEEQEAELRSREPVNVSKQTVPDLLQHLGLIDEANIKIEH